MGEEPGKGDNPRCFGGKSKAADAGAAAPGCACDWHKGRPSYHTKLLAFDLDGIGEAGIVGCAVGAPFAVVVTQLLFASVCWSASGPAGQTTLIGPTPYFILTDRAPP